MMQDCSVCGRTVKSGSEYVCNMGIEKFVISNYPGQGESCKAFEQTTRKDSKPRVNDPLLNFFSRRKHPPVKLELEQKIETTQKPETKESQPLSTVGYSNQEINFKYALGWIISAVLSGTIISLLLLGLIG
jgi:hypothetical protein